MNSELVSRLEEREARHSLRMTVVELMGPLTILGGLVWAVAQPYRVTLLHPRGVGFWDLLVQPPLLVVAVGAVFAFLIAPGIVEDLRDAEAEAG